MGLIVPKHKHSGVERNALKRRLRELVRLRLLPGAPARDVVIRARREAYDATFEALGRDVERAADQLRRSTFDVGRPTRDGTPSSSGP